MSCEKRGFRKAEEIYLTLSAGADVPLLFRRGLLPIRALSAQSVQSVFWLEAWNADKTDNAGIHG